MKTNQGKSHFIINDTHTHSVKRKAANLSSSPTMKL